MDRDKKLLKNVKQKVLLHEPATFIGMAGVGKDHLFTAVVQYLESNRPKEYELFVCNTISVEELREFIAILQKQDTPVIACINIFLTEDASWLVDALDNLRYKHQEGFIFYLFSGTKEVYSAFNVTSKALMQYLTMLHLVNYNDAKQIIAEHTNKIKSNLSEDEKKEIFELSCGHAGLVKALTLLRLENPDARFTSTFLLAQPSMVYKLSSILKDFPAEIIDKVVHGQLTNTEKTQLRQIGLLQGDKFFNPLLSDMYRMIHANKRDFSFLEERVYDLLCQQTGKIVSKNDIAKAIWGEDDWEIKYSEWAISQLMYRMKKKLVKLEPSATIKVAKGKGYLLQA